MQSAIGMVSVIGKNLVIMMPT